jgi:hypothetical protein
MKKMSYLVLLGLVGCLPPKGSSEPAPGTGTSASAGSETAQAEPEMVCKREHVTGSSISKRVCRPKNEARTAADQQQISELQRRSSTITQGTPR